jgi:hypothetical protein
MAKNCIRDTSSPSPWPAAKKARRAPIVRATVQQNHIHTYDIWPHASQSLHMATPASPRMPSHMSSPSLFQVGFEDQNFTHIYDPHLKINVQHFQHLESLGLEEWMQPVHVPTDAEIEQNIRDMNFRWESEAATRQEADCLSSEPLFPGLDTSPPNFYPDGQIPDSTLRFSVTG